MMLQKLVNRDERGFTLVELLIVVAIIAILAAIAIPQFQKYRYRAWRGELSSDAKNAFTAAQAYLSDTPTGTVNSLTILTNSGYRKSDNVAFREANLTLSAGNINLYSTPLNAAGQVNNEVVISYDGAITYK